MKINNKKFFVIILLMLGLNLQLSAFEKVGTTSFQFLKVYPGARANAMSGAFCTLADNSEALFWNPAGIARINDFDATFNYISWVLDIKHFAFSAAYNLGDWGVVGLHGIMTDVGVIEETRVDMIGVGGLVNGMFNPGLTGNTFEPASMVIGLSYAQSLTDRFSFGVTVKYVQENLIYQKADAFVFDGGFLFDTRYKSIVIGASIRQFGPEVKFIDKNYPLPQTFNIGVSAHLFSPEDPLISTIEDHSLLFSYDIIQPRDYDQMHSMGLEYSFKDMIFLRGGYTFNSDQEGLSAGVGLNVDKYRVDYSFSDYGEYLDSVHRITIGFELN